MAKQEKFKSFKIPEPMAVGYSFMMFVEHVVDRVPEFQSVSGARKGGALIDAVAAAEKSDGHLVKWPSSLWECVVRTLRSEQFQLPKTLLIRNNTPTDQLVPLRDYLPLADAVLDAEDWEDKSAVEKSEPQAAQDAPS